MDMTPQETAKALSLLERIADGLHSQPYTITGAADWPLLLALCGILGLILSVAAWAIVRNVDLSVNNLKEFIRNNDSGVRVLLDKEVDDREKGDQVIWDEIHKMQTKSENEHTTLRQELTACKEKCHG